MNKDREKIGIFGAGEYGRRALSETGSDRVWGFIDNNCSLWGTMIEGIQVVGDLDAYVNRYPDSPILVAIRDFRSVAKILEERKVDYEVYFPRKNWYGDTTRLFVNPYETREVQLSERIIPLDEAVEIIEEINSHVYYLEKQKPLFNHIEIETYNRCNGGCDFCPVSVKNERREEHHMSEELFKKIVSELRSVEYNGCLALFSNNEPFLDDRVIDFCKYARKELPKAKMHLFTNGTKLTLSMFVEIIDELDELIIDNYSVSLEMLKPVKKIYDYCKGNKELEKKVTIVLRNPQEVLESRGGYSPNKERVARMKEVRCTHPYRQMIIRPDGKVSLCCNDALGVTCMGDCNTNSLIEIWNGKEFERVRNQISNAGRGAVDFCKYCDSLRIV